MRWVYTGIIRPKFTYGALVWAHNISPKQHKKLKQLNRIACMSLTPTTRSTPQAALEIMYNITPLDLHLTETGLKTYLRLKTQLDNPKKPRTYKATSNTGTAYKPTQNRYGNQMIAATKHYGSSNIQLTWTASMVVKSI